MAGGAEMSMEAECAGLEVHSKRLDERFVWTRDTRSIQPELQHGGFAVPTVLKLRHCIGCGVTRVDREAILRAHREQTLKRVVQSEQTIWRVQDTASRTYNTPEQMQGIGYISSERCSY